MRLGISPDISPATSQKVTPLHKTTVMMNFTNRSKMRPNANFNRVSPKFEQESQKTWSLKKKFRQFNQTMAEIGRRPANDGDLSRIPLNLQNSVESINYAPESGVE